MSGNQVFPSKEERKHSGESWVLYRMNPLNQRAPPPCGEEIPPAAPPVLLRFPGEDLNEELLVRGVRHERKRTNFTFQASDHVFAFPDLPGSGSTALGDVSLIAECQINARGGLAKFVVRSKQPLR